MSLFNTDMFAVILVWLYNLLIMIVPYEAYARRAFFLFILYPFIPK
jgi:hypothetical protein